MLGTVHAPVFEIIHFISHCIVDHQQSDMHFYADHSHSHTHKYLSSIDTNDAEDNESEQLIEPPTNKVEYLDQITAFNNGQNDQCSKLLDYTKPLIGIMISIPSPPPKAIS